MDKARFAGQRIKDVLEYIDTPTAGRDRGRNDPSFYGWTESQWMKSQDNLHQRIQRDGPTESILKTLANEHGMSEQEINKYIEWSEKANNNVSRAVSYGTPHAQTGETLALKALQASGIDARMGNLTNPQDTDLQVMVGRLKRLMDVQYRINDGRDMMALGALMGLRHKTGLDAWFDAPANVTFGSIIDNAIDRNNGRYLTDKLTHERGARDTRPGQVKDYLITGRIDRNNVSNLTGNINHGNWDATAPDSFSVVNMDRLRDGLFNTSKRDLIKQGVRVVGDKKKLKLNVPFDLVQKIASDSTFIDPELNHAIAERYS